MYGIHFTDQDGTFELERPEDYSYLYFPLAGEKGLKSSMAPNLGGDSKLDQTSFLLEPVSSENLHNNRSTRNFWVKPDNGQAWSAAGSSAEAENDRFTEAQDDSKITAGFMWQTMERSSRKYGLKSQITSFVPEDLNAEVMYVKIKNTSDGPVDFTPVAAVPIYGRSADNIRDHRNVTSMLHRISTEEYGVVVTPAMSFDERGHKKNHTSYFVAGVTGDGKAPTEFFPTVDIYLGEGGTYTHPGALYRDLQGVVAGQGFAGKEAVGAFAFERVTLAPGEETDFTILLGITPEGEDLAPLIDRFSNGMKTRVELRLVQDYWKKKVNIGYHTGDKSFDELMKWVTFQPFLRRIFGCSFLPHHDYGRGGRGWRDLWQDSLSLLMMNPKEVRDDLVSYFGGVRIDGTNATIIGDHPGEFKADRNGIARVWMDHGMWPFLTIELYLNQTGDFSILSEKVPYFQDREIFRGTEKDNEWKEENGTLLVDKDGNIVEGTVLEHILIENLTAFYEVGQHNIIRLRGADWNDALDMADENGESVAFTFAYAGNLKRLSKLCRYLSEKEGIYTISIPRALTTLIDTGVERYESVESKTGILQTYLSFVQPHISDERTDVSLDHLAESLEEKADWLMNFLRRQEWIRTDSDSWFNSYYDNSGRRVEGVQEDGSVRMMLTGQVFAIMSGTASDEQVADIVRAADDYLYRKEIGGYRLNTDFHELKMDLGRMFGFAYGEKENGAVFSHMTVMFANALYGRGFAKEGWKAIKTLTDAAMNFEKSRIYPGVPEYFSSDGRGMYNYLTGAASWLMMTVVQQMYGIKGVAGDLVITPRLCADQFDADGAAEISLPFAGSRINVIIENPGKKNAGSYQISGAFLNGNELSHDNDSVSISRALIENKDKVADIRIMLG